MSKQKIVQLNIFGEKEIVKAIKKTQKELLEDYEAFTEKFKPKKTTDDCYTPPLIYDTVRDWVNKNICALEGRRIVRPFRPGGDFENEEYLPGDVVLDNPPFSIMVKIVRFYMARNIDFFLFANHLTLFTTLRVPGVTAIVANVNITYENGANINTSFVTNMEGRHRAIVAGDLYRELKEADDIQRKTGQPVKKIRLLSYPSEVVSAAILGKIAVRGIRLSIPFSESVFISKLENWRHGIFGGGLLISERMAAERMAAERLAAERLAAERLAAERLAAERLAAKEVQYIQLSEKEKETVRSLGK